MRSPISLYLSTRNLPRDKRLLLLPASYVSVRRHQVGDIDALTNFNLVETRSDGGDDRDGNRSRELATHSYDDGG